MSKSAKGKGKERSGSIPTVHAVPHARKPDLSIPDASTLEEAEDPVCFICAEAPQFYAVGTCSHTTCHVCAVRLRVLYKTSQCTYCKTELPHIIFTESPNKPYTNFRPDDTPFHDQKLGASFESAEQMEETLALLRFNCPHQDCAYAAQGWADLKRHVKTEHKLAFCDLCLKHKKVFTHEFPLYTAAQLRQHYSKGDNKASQTSSQTADGFQGHPTCGFCLLSFYDSDMLYKHCRDDHEQCFLCLKNGGDRWQYYRDYKDLERHFNDAHHPCLAPTCLEKKFIVFNSSLDLQVHQVEEHGAKKAARRIETNFTYDAPSRGPFGYNNYNARDHAGWGQEYFQAEASSSSIAPDPWLEDAREALNREHGSRKGKNRAREPRIVPGMSAPRPRRGFGANLTAYDEAIQAEDQAEAERKAVDADTLGRHNAFMETFKAMVSGSESKVLSLKTAIRTYRNNEMSASDLVDTITALLDRNIVTSQETVNGVAVLLDNREKSIELLAEWANYERAQNAFPSLPNTESARPVASLYNGRQVLKAKQATQSRKPASQAAVWERVEQAAASSSGQRSGPPSRSSTPGLPQAEKFPSLPTGKAKAASSTRATPWASASAASSARKPVVTSVHRPSTQSPRPAKVDTSAFPSLPPSSTVKQRAVQKAAIFGAQSKSTNEWGPNALAQQFDDLEVSDHGNQSQGSGKKKKKGKTLLMYHGI